MNSRVDLSKTQFNTDFLDEPQSYKYILVQNN